MKFRSLGSDLPFCNPLEELLSPLCVRGDSFGVLQKWKSDLQDLSSFSAALPKNSAPSVEEEGCRKGTHVPDFKRAACSGKATSTPHEV